MKRSTLSTSDPLPRGAWISMDGEKALRVVRCRGAGPYTVTVRPERWTDPWEIRIRRSASAPRRWWRETRCLRDDGWCWRKATSDYLCDRHWLAAIEDGDEL